MSEYVGINPLVELFKGYCIAHDLDWADDLETRLQNKLNQESEEIDFSHNQTTQKDFLK